MMHFIQQVLHQLRAGFRVAFNSLREGSAVPQSESGPTDPINYSSNPDPEDAI